MLTLKDKFRQRCGFSDMHTKVLVQKLSCIQLSAKKLKNIQIMIFDTLSNAILMKIKPIKCPYISTSSLKFEQIWTENS